MYVSICISIILETLRVDIILVMEYMLFLQLDTDITIT
jgi:hypothetical protein